MRTKSLLLVSMFIVGASLAAQEGMAWVGPQVGLLRQRNDQRGAKSAALFGVSGGKWFTERWGAEVGYLFTTVDSNNGKGSGSQQYLHGSVLFNLYTSNENCWNAYARAGAAAVRVQPPWAGTEDDRWSSTIPATTKTAGVLGLGVQYRLKDNWLLGAELKMIRYEPRLHEWPVMFTAAWRFGGASCGQYRHIQRASQANALSGS